MSADVAMLAEVPLFQLEQVLPGEPAKPGIERQRSLFEVVGQPLVRVEQRLLDHVGRIETRRQPTIEPHRDHPAQPIPMPHQELLPRSAIAAKSAGNQFLSVGIVRYDHGVSLSNTDLPEREER